MEMKLCEECLRAFRDKQRIFPSDHCHHDEDRPEKKEKCSLCSDGKIAIHYPNWGFCPFCGNKLR